ncbi:MAG: class I SAM-dependent RNA methyltransferase [Verrucomicrobiales bacterium]|nr:class I SAM-dependent RNA methyltransferase [Verrucomicrobiales bacterium]
MTQNNPKKKNRFKPGPFEYHEEIEVEISSLTNMGQGIARTDKNWVILVPFCVPGEKVVARIYSNQKNYSEADLLKVISPSPERVHPECKIFGSCGGCQYQHIKYPEQLRWKKIQVEELLLHMAGITCKVDEVTQSPQQYSYRTKLTPHFNKPKDGVIGSIGFQQPGRRSLVDVEVCPIAHQTINDNLKNIRKEVTENSNTYKRGSTLLIRVDSNGQIHTKPDSIAVEKVGPMEFHFPAGSFFQNNASILEDFTNYVKSEAKSSGQKHLVDAYCGAGLFSLTSASEFKSVIGIEVSVHSIKWAKFNAKINQISNASFLAGKVEDLFKGVDVTGDETTIVIDPPRKGCSKDFLDQLFAFSPDTVIYVSCNPATQMRDLKLFLKSGFQLKRVMPFDLFPQTKHLECVMTLSRNNH